MRPGRLHSTLVYFGLVEDDAVAQRLADTPLTGWRRLAVLLAMLALSVAAWAVLRLVGIDADLASFVAFGVGAAVLVLVSEGLQQRKLRRR